MALVLIVDDELEIRDYIRAVLDEEHLVIEASNGQDALRLTQKVKPSLVILDIMLENSIPTGGDLCIQLSKTPALAGMPILAISGYADRKDISDILLCATDFLAKPFKVEELTSRVDNLLKLEEGTLTRLLASASENSILEAVVGASMVGNAAKILRALKAGIEQVEANLG